MNEIRLTADYLFSIINYCLKTDIPPSIVKKNNEIFITTSCTLLYIQKVYVDQIQNEEKKPIFITSIVQMKMFTHRLIN